jgi:beta-phosphoglucomutase-like phosphatase (HAD superfamily)
VVVLKIKAVLFDMGDTLVRTRIPEVTYQNVLSSVGIDRPIEALREAINKTEKEFKESVTSRGMATLLSQSIGKDGPQRSSNI